MCLACEVGALLDKVETLEGELRRANLLLAANMARTAPLARVREGHPAVASFLPSELESLRGLTLTIENHPVGGFNVSLLRTEEQPPVH